MASVCVNNVVGVTTPASTKFSSFAWLTPPRLSFTRDRDRDRNPDDVVASSKAKPNAAAVAEATDLDDNDDASDFEFRLDDPVAMLPADELISDGKLMPMTALPLPVSKHQPSQTRRITEALTATSSSGSVDPNLFSPRAPRCASRWKEMFGLKKLNQNSSKSLKSLLRRNSKSSSQVPLLRDSSDCESLSRLSLSSSSSGHDLEDSPRLSADADKLNNSINPISLLKSVAINSNPNNPNPPPRIRLLTKPRPPPDQNAGSTRMRRTGTAAASEPPYAAAAAAVATYADSPRMNPSGKVVFHSLERSSSSPGSFNGGPRLKHISGMERSYSAHVRVTPVLNVPVCSLSKSGNVLGFGQLFSNSTGGTSSGTSRSYQSINNSRRNRS